MEPFASDGRATSSTVRRTRETRGTAPCPGVARVYLSTAAGRDHRSMRIFVFARHAESAANRAHVVDSDPSHAVGLTPRGRRQASVLGAQLARLPIDRAVCSRFLRTQQTAEIATDGRGIPLVVEAALDEIDAGALDGVPMETYWAWKDGHERGDRFPGGESLDEAVQRYAGAVRGLLVRDDPVTLVVCHELGLRSIADASGSGAPLRIGNAEPYLFDEPHLRRAVDRLDGATTPQSRARRDGRARTSRSVAALPSGLLPERDHGSAPVRKRDRGG
jgi:broad specificity phosphatase PhoE